MSGTEGEEPTVRELAEQLQKLITEYNELVEVLEYLPSVHTVNLIRLLGQAVELFRNTPMDVWSALFDYVDCDTSGLADLAVEEQKRIIEVLEKVAALELLLADDGDRKEALEAWLEQLRDALEDWDDDQTREAATAVLDGLKEFLQTHYPEILVLLGQYFGDEVRRAFEKWAEKHSLSLLKIAVWLFISQILSKYIGKEAAKRLNPMVSIAFSIAELVAIGYVVPKLENLEALIGDMRAELVRRLAEKGMGWVDQFPFVWVGYSEKYEGKVVELDPYVRCAFEEDGELTWRDKCPVDFEEGGEKRYELVGDDSDGSSSTAEPARSNEKENRWELPYDIDKASVEKCTEGAALCYLVVEMSIVGKDGGINFIAGVMVS